MIDITSVYNALSGFVGEYWAGFIVTAVVAVCALAQTAMSPPTENSSALYKILYEHADRIVSNTSTEKTAANHGQTFPQPCRPSEQRGEQFSPGHIISPYCRERRSWTSRSCSRTCPSRHR